MAKSIDCEIIWEILAAGHTCYHILWAAGVLSPDNRYKQHPISYELSFAA